MLRQIQMMVRRLVLVLAIMLAAMQFGLAQEDALQQVRQQVDLINEEVVKLYGQGKYAAALAQAKKAVALSERGLGAEHPDTGASLSNLATLHKSMGAYGNALPLYQRALAIAEKAHGPEHPDTGTRLNNLASLHESMGAYDKALPLYLRALAIAEKAQGPENLATGTFLNNLAELYRTIGAYDNALPLYLRALAIFEKAHGPEHPVTSASLNNLAALHQSMGAYDKALPLCQRALAIAEKTLGPEHPDTGIRLNNLASLHESMSAYDKALPLYQRTLAIAEKSQGPEHPSTGTSLNNLALLHQTMGAYDKALPLVQRALAIAEKAQGPEHPDTGTYLNNLAALHESIGAYDKALPLGQRALAIFEKAHGLEHPDTGASLNNLAALHDSMGAYDKALPLYQRALAIAEKAQGPEHPDTGNRLNNLAALYFSQEKYVQALQLLLRAFAIAISRGSANPELLAKVANNLCLLKQTTSRPEAIFYCKIAVNTRQTQRESAKSMGKELQLSLQAKTQAPYLLLNRLLTFSQRYYESEEVLLAMKVAEFNHITRADTVAATGVSRTATEAKLENELNDLGLRFGKLLAEQEKLKSAAADANALAKNREQINIANKNIQENLAKLATALKVTDKEAADTFPTADTRFNRLANELEIEMPQEGNLMLVIVADAKTTTVQIITPSGPLPLQLALGMDDLNPLISAMRNAILNRSEDYRGPAKEIYQRLIAPIEAAIPNLAAVKTFTLYLNGRLRALPLAALMDANGKHFAEKYRFGLYNSIAHDKAALVPQNWQVMAWGNKEANTVEGLRALAGVEQELGAIVYDQKSGSGLLPGKRYFGPQFNRQAWDVMLAQKPAVTKAKPQSHRSVVHVATHFKISTQQFNDSKLFLGDGSTFSLGQLNSLVIDLSDVDLLTLSACNSITSEKANGEQFEGLGAAFQNKGVKAVLGTLWAVEDASTAHLMQQFYSQRGAQRKMSKAQALQAAQLGMMKHKQWAHPFYWAGFVLMGNWL